MEHQKQIAYQRIDNLHSGISKAEELVNNARQMLNHNDMDITLVQKELEEIQDFLLWLASQ
ncbi:TPA: hypothetical protein N2D99_002027 [Clostridium botulinum]|nr:hypothetical protein [Clostridium botulinum]